jgi:hypothetical protein
MSAIRGSCLCGGVKFEITGSEPPSRRPLHCGISIRPRSAQGQLRRIPHEQGDRHERHAEAAFVAA